MMKSFNDKSINLSDEFHLTLQKLKLSDDLMKFHKKRLSGENGIK